MAILVDELREYPDAAAAVHGLVPHGDRRLVRGAARVRRAGSGLRRAWFQRDHYDLPPHGRAAAVALGAEEVATGELLLRMAGPRGERARRRALAPAGVAWLRGGGGPAVLRYPAGALVVIGGPPGAGKSTLARAPSSACRCSTRTARAPRSAPARRGRRRWRRGATELRAALAAGAGAVAVTTALRHGHRLGLARAAVRRRRPGPPAAARRRRGALPRRPRGQGDERIPDGLFEHLLREWEAYRRDLSTATDPAPFASITIARPRGRRTASAGSLLSPSTRG